MNMDYAIGFMTFSLPALPFSDMMGKFFASCSTVYPLKLSVIDAEHICSQMLDRSVVIASKCSGKAPYELVVPVT